MCTAPETSRMGIVRTVIASNDALVILADVYDVSDRDLILEQIKKARYDVFDEGLAAKADCETDDAGPGKKGGDVDPEMRQNHQPSHDDDCAQQSRLE